MTQELLSKAVELDRKINQCDKALKYQTNGTFHQYACQNEGIERCCLPYEVCQEIRKVIEKFKKDYEKQLEEL